MTEHNLPVPDDAPWLNLSPQEVEQLRKQKHELTAYAQEKIRNLMKNQEPYPDEMLAKVEETNKASLESLGINYGDFEGENDLDYYAPNGDYIKSYPLINRVEVISKNGREFVQYDCSNVQVSEQDEGRTLKVFLS